MKFYNLCAFLLFVDCFSFSKLEKTSSISNYTSEIKELNNPNVHIRDKNRVNEILKSIIQCGTKRLQIITDFDRTVTKQHKEGSNEITTISSFSLFTNCPSVPKKYLITQKYLFDKYFPHEIDVSIPKGEKQKLMEEWWGLLEGALNGLTVSQEEIQDTAAKSEIYLRNGTEKLFDDLTAADVPVLVFSAGLGDTVTAVLNNFKILYSNVKVISNFLKYDNQGVIRGFQSSPIHILNKNEFALHETDYYQLIKNRDNIVLMGDSLGDSGMADGVNHANVILKIGFLFGNVEKNLPIFMNKFDIVLIDDQTMDVISAILKYVF